MSELLWKLHKSVQRCEKKYVYNTIQYISITYNDGL